MKTNNSYAGTRLGFWGHVSRRVTLIVAVGMILLTGLTQLVTSYIVELIITRNSEEALRTSVSSTTALLDDWLNARADRVVSMGKSMAFAGNESPEALQAYVHAQLEDDENALMYYVCTEKDKLVLPADYSTIDLDPTSRSWWSACIDKDTAAFTDPYVDAATGTMVVSISYAYKINGNQYVILADISLNTLVNTVNSIADTNDNTTAFLLASDGSVITHENSEFLPNDQGNTILSEKVQLNLDATELTDYTEFDGTERTLFTGVVSATGWKLGITRAKVEVTQSVGKALMGGLIFIGFFLIIFLLVTALILKKILAPISLMTNSVSKVSRGDFSERIPVRNRNDDLGILQKSVAELIEILNALVADTNRVLSSLSSYDLTAADMKEYPGAFNEMSKSVNNVKAILRDLLTQMYGAARSVDDGSTQFTAAAESLSVGASTQASSISTLEGRIHNMADRIDNNSAQCGVVNDKLAILNKRIEEGNAAMKLLFDAVNDVESMSTDIQKIVSAIDAIAFQTNILALNAAVESARAGDQGKGFAVVSEEVRSLAAKCAEESNKTAQLIQGCIESITAAKTHADSTMNCLTMVTTNSNDIADAFNSISNDTSEQAADAEEMRHEINNIANIVQTNTAASQQTAASTHELSNQAQTLSEAVNKFKL